METAICGGKLLPLKFTPNKSQGTLRSQVYKVIVPLHKERTVCGEKNYNVDVEGDLVNTFEVGQTVVIIGVVKSRTKRLSSMKRFGILALNVEIIEDSLLSNDITRKTHCHVLEAWKQDQENHNSEISSRNEMIKNLFPHIVGAHIIKLAILLSICSGSGKYKDSTDGLEKRDVVHLMLAGQRSAGKHNLVRSATDLIKNTEVHPSGLSITALTARTSKGKQKGTDSIEAGVMLRANGGISCFYNFECLGKKIRNSMHEIMETQQVKVATCKLKIKVFKKIKAYFCLQLTCRLTCHCLQALLQPTASKV